MRIKKDIARDMKEIRKIVEKCPEAINYLSSFQREVIQALMRNNEGNAAAKEGKELAPSPP